MEAGGGGQGCEGRTKGWWCAGGRDANKKETAVNEVKGIRDKVGGNERG